MMLHLPFPPSGNKVWRHVGQRVLLSREAKAYIDTVKRCVLASGLEGLPVTGKIAIEIAATKPDRQRRDLDNLLKITLDCCTKAGVWCDDSQIHELFIYWTDRIDPCGGLLLTINPMEEQ